MYAIINIKYKINTRATKWKVSLQGRGRTKDIRYPLQSLPTQTIL